MAGGESDRLRGAAAALGAIADALDAERADPEELDTVIAQLAGIRSRAFGPSTRPGSARERLGRLLTERVGEWVPGSELAETAGISEWARRIRELRASGYRISESNGCYRLDELPRD